MGWLTKILKGSSHKISEGRYHGRYEDEVRSEPHNSGVISVLSIYNSLLAIAYLCLSGLAAIGK